MGWHDTRPDQMKVSNEKDVASRATRASTNMPGFNVEDSVEKRVLPLHTNEMNEKIETNFVVEHLISDGASLRTCLDSMQLHSIEDNDFEELLESDFYDTTQRESIQKRHHQKRPSNLNLLGPIWSGQLEKKGTSFEKCKQKTTKIKSVN